MHVISPADEWQHHRSVPAACRRQLEEVSDLLDVAAPQLSQKLNRLDCSEIYFAYRMVLVMMRRELPLSEVLLSAFSFQVYYFCKCGYCL